MILLYLDPGSQNFLITLLVAILTTGGIYLAQSRIKIKKWFARKKKKPNEVPDDEEEESDILKPPLEKADEGKGNHDKNSNLNSST